MYEAVRQDLLPGGRIGRQVRVEGTAFLYWRDPTTRARCVAFESIVDSRSRSPR